MGTHAKGIQFQISNGAATPVYTTVAEVTDLQGPGITVPTTELTHHQSEAGEHAAGIPDWGEVTIEGNFLSDHATQDDATGLISTLGSENDCRIVWPNAAATTWSFAAMMTAFRPSAPVTGKLGFSATFKLNGGCAIT